jgi:phosphomannomutase/phosphoglucomutase
LSGDALKDALISGLLSKCDVTDIGIVSTPMLYFATNLLKKKSGVMIAASHNPPECNGFKLFKQNGCIHGEEMTQIKNIAKTSPTKPAEKTGKVTQYARIFQDYARFMSEKIKVEKKLNVVADTGNGVCGLFVPSLFNQHKCNILTLNEKPDGRFPAHLPEPNEETLQELKQKVVETGADFGVGYDGDGDRAVFVDEKGRIFPGDLTLMIFAKHILQKHKGGSVVYELSCSMAIEEYVRKYSGNPIVERVGHTYIMDRMIAENALLGGEKSGHLYFSECNGGDDAIFASLKMAEIMSTSSEKLSEMFDSLPKYPSIVEENFKVPDSQKFALIEKLKINFQNRSLKFLGSDGIKLIYKDGWILMRASNTEPVIRISAEARTQERLKEIYEFSKNELKQAMEES